MDTTNSSDFIYHNIQDCEKEFTHISELPSHGFNVLVKAKRFGKWFLLKGLKEEYRRPYISESIVQGVRDYGKFVASVSRVGIFY